MLKHTASRRLLACLVSLVLLLSCASAFSAQAAQYSGGSGTRKDPYLIKTPDDLYNMRNNLDKDFMLAATIDMKGYKTNSKYFKNGFVPIGDDSTKPFTGTFRCNLGKDGLPLYAILNLNIYNAKGEIYGHDYYGPDWYNKDYPGYPDAYGLEAPYYYQTALFGNIKGATLLNIYVLNANVYSSVVGQGTGIYVNNVESNFINYSKFMDEQATAILAAFAVESTITHCAVTGKASGKSSISSAFVGMVDGTTITNSYADADVRFGGWWAVGHFAGRLKERAVIKNCFSLGTLLADSAGLDPSRDGPCGGRMSGFASELLNAEVTDCYSGVKLLKGSYALNFSSGGGIFMNSTIKNCFTYGDFEGKTAPAGGTPTASNCFISSASTGAQNFENLTFKVASPKEINDYFATQKGWEKGTTYPVLKDTHYVTDASIFVPGQERTTEVVSAVVSELENQDSETTDETTSDGATDETVSGSGDAQQGTVTVVGEASSDNELGLPEIVVMALLTAMIIGISVLSAIIALNVLRKNKVPVVAEAEDDFDDIDDIIYSSSEGDIDDEE